MNPVIHPNIVSVLLGIFILLVIASFTSIALKLRHPGDRYIELRQRVQSWWVMVTFFTIALLFSRTLSLIFFGFISFLALKEYFSIIPTRRADRRVLFWAYLAIPFQYYWISQEWYGMFVIFIPVYLFLLLPMRMVTIGDTKNFLAAAGTLHWGLMTMVFSLSHLAYLLTLAPVSSDPNITINGTPELPGGAGLVLFLVFLTQFNDVSQYIWGKWLGKHKIIPKVSPNKTWQGFIGGVGTTILCSLLLAPLLTPMSLAMSAVAGGLISVAGFIGDVTISALKRDIGVKDSGSMLPGHGGIMDRIDSLTYTAPLFFHFTYFFYY